MEPSRPSGRRVKRRTERMKSSLSLCALALLLTGSGTSGQTAHADASPPSERPNVLFLLSDDHGTGTMGCEGHPWSKTPALDRLASEGVRFANAFVTTSLCSPGRASFLTGMYARRHGVLNNETLLSEQVPSFAASLTAAGYDSMYVGKFHMGDQRTRPGFTRSASYLGQGEYYGCEFLVNGKLMRTKRWVDDVATDIALAFLREERDRPFLLCLGFKAAHGPRIVPADLETLYRDAVLPPPVNVDSEPPFPRKRELRDLMNRDRVGSRTFTTPEDWDADPGTRRPDLWQSQMLKATGAETLAEVPNWLDQDLANYYRQIHALDRNVGRVLAALDELELADHTVVVYSSDNGMQNGEHGLRFKRSAYEASLRVPLLLRYPPLTRGGVVLDQLALNIDLAPTLLDLAGVEIPPAMQGRSWRPLLAPGAEPPEWRQAFLYEYVREWAYFNPTVFAARTRDWKLVRYPGYPSWTELFDLRRDPHELVNLAENLEYRDKLEEMSVLLADLQSQAGPRPPVVR